MKILCFAFAMSAVMDAVDSWEMCKFLELRLSGRVDSVLLHSWLEEVVKSGHLACKILIWRHLPTS